MDATKAHLGGRRRGARRNEYQRVSLDPTYRSYKPSACTAYNHSDTF